MTSPEETAGASASAKIRKRYRIRALSYAHEVEDCLTDEYVFRGTQAECQLWIDCAAFAAGVQAIMQSPSCADDAYEYLEHITGKGEG